MRNGKFNLFIHCSISKIFCLFFRVKSCIDGRLLDGVYSIRVHNGVDYSGKRRFIRWTEVFVIQVCYVIWLRIINTLSYLKTVKIDQGI